MSARKKLILSLLFLFIINITLIWILTGTDGGGGFLEALYTTLRPGSKL
jgi:hypothetical protein